jgi:hypothetical protein
MRAIVLAGVLAPAIAVADTEPVVIKHPRAQELIVRAWIAGGTRRFDGGGFSGDSNGGLILGGEVGYRVRPNLGPVAVFTADAMAPSSYLSYGVSTIGAGIHWDGPVVVTVGGGVALENSSAFLPDYTLASDSHTGATAFVHATLPLFAIGSGKLGANLDVAAISLSDGPQILSGSLGVGVAW